MPEAVNLGSGRGAGWLNDANTEIKNLFSNTITIGSFAMFDSDSNAAYTVPAGRKLTILTVDYIGSGGISGDFYIQSYSGGVFVGSKMRLPVESDTHYKIDTGFEFSAGQQVYTQNPGASVSCNCFGVESTV
jgi:hypothetical protein|tara:strand:- start:468 stop:863 length:396 start_codon:yes stop_codon:yes gene_type:complete